MATEQDPDQGSSEPNNHPVNKLSPFDSYIDFQLPEGQSRLFLPNLPSQQFKKDITFNLVAWCTLLRRRNPDRPISMQEAISSLFNLMSRNWGIVNAKRTLEKIRTPTNWRYWCDVAAVEAGYVSRYWPLFSTTGLLRIEGKHRISTNSALDSRSGLVFRVPYYANLPLREIKYIDFVEAMNVFNPDKEFLRPEYFWIFHAVITSDYHFEPKEEQFRVLDQARSSKADKFWDKIYGEKVQYNHPSREEQRVGSEKSISAYLLPHSVHHNVGNNVFCAYAAFTPGFLAVNRLRRVSEANTRYAYRAVLRDRVEAGISSKEWMQKHLDTMHKREANLLWDGIKLYRECVVGPELDFDNHKPRIPSEFRLLVRGDFVIPTAQPEWLDEEFKSFLLIMLVINLRDRPKPTLVEIKAAWKSLKWEQHWVTARALCEQEKVEETYSRFCRELQQEEPPQTLEVDMEVEEQITKENSDNGLYLHQTEGMALTDLAVSSSARMAVPRPRTASTQMLPLEEAITILDQLSANLDGANCEGYNAAEVKACGQRLSDKLILAKRRLDAKMRVIDEKSRPESTPEL